MLKIRLQRRGTRHKLHHTIVVMEHRAPKGGRVVELLGSYHPLHNPPQVVVQRERVEHWLRHGAQLSPTVAKLLRAATRAQPTTAH